MAKKSTSPVPNKPAPDRWEFFHGIKALLSAFPQATTGQKAAIVAMSFGVVMFIGLGLVGSVLLPAWAIVIMFSVGAVLIFATAGMLVIIEREAKAQFRCRNIPTFPLDDATRSVIAAALEEIRADAAAQLLADANITYNDIRANIFLLAQVIGGAADGTWKLVIHPDFAINMTHPPELQLQFSIGQGATGVAYRDGTYHLTRRLVAPKEGEWEQKFQMTPELSAQIHKRLKWIVTFPLLRPNTNEALGVLNIDGLTDVPDDDLLNTIASKIQHKVDVIGNNLSLQRSICVGIDQLGVMEHV
jgi:hypothetical protein